MSLVLHASGPVAVVLWTLVGAAVAAWVLIVVKDRQLRRWRAAERAFERALQGPRSLAQIVELCERHQDAPGARVVAALCRRHREPDVLPAVAEAVLAEQQERLSRLMPALASIGSASPFVGLLGTVYGIMDAFLRIGREKSATLPVVAPAIGEALIATAVGLFAAIPAVVAYNALSKRIEDFLGRVQATSRQWVVVVSRGPGGTSEGEG
ncbi:MAG: MotA/TolQ/ExbB proton channel family protein [Myxococcales bacterium]|nr:MotA/TolQ/ExbB proton channel family protein [Myxococcales bacterium]MCB9718689.1 MotA/TolQ/ExbB proton channel family protein [Myxococcales bacterium]